MSTEKLIAALPLAALFAAVALHAPSASAQEAPAAPAQENAAAPAPAQQGMVVVRDPQTGQLRAPTATEMQALTKQRPSQSQGLSQGQGRALAAPAKPTGVTRANGTRRVYMGDKNQVYTVVTRDAEGKLVKQCVQGEEAAKAAVDHPATTTEEHAHEDR
jgi:hypothetical protein